MANEGYEWVGGGLQQEVEQVTATICFDNLGIASASLCFLIDWDSAVGVVTSRTRHPDFEWLVLESAKITREEANCAKVEINYAGIPPVVDEDRCEYTLTGGVQTEPIETHPNFPTFGGVPNKGVKSTTTRGANFDENGKFLGFAVQGPNDSYYPDDNTNKAGVRSYFEPSIIYSECKTYDYQSSQTVGVIMNALGEIDTPPGSNILPTIATGRSWLLVGATANTVGDGMKVCRKWRLSGRRGWDVEIYSP